MNISVVAEIKNGRPQLSKDQKKRINNAFQSLDKKLCRITVGNEGKIRTNPQNAYYWGIVLKLISEFNGDTEDDLHNYFKSVYAPKKTVKVMGQEIVEPMSTTEMTTAQFGEYIERIRAFASAELQVVIPDPTT